MSTPPTTADRRTALLDEWGAVRREIARLEAISADILAERMRMCDADGDAHPTHRETIYRSMVAEHAAAGHMAGGTVELAFADARALDDHLPGMREALREGRIAVQHVREATRAIAIVCEAVDNGAADASVIADFDEAAVAITAQGSPARSRPQLRQIASVLAGEHLHDRHARAEGERQVTVRPLEDGLAILTAVLPEALAVAIHDRLTRMTRHITRARDESGSQTGAPAQAGAPDMTPHGDHDGDDVDDTSDMRGESDADSAEGIVGGLTAADVADTRTFDQIRADLFTDLLLASDPSAAHGDGLDRITGHIQVTIPAATLTGAGNEFAELDGHGPLHPDIARDLAGRNSGWSRLFLTTTGMVSKTDTYTPTEQMRRHLRARDQHCRFPGCGSGAGTGDIGCG